jgi:hypothetical protein
MPGFDGGRTRCGFRSRVEYFVFCLFKLWQADSGGKRTASSDPLNLITETVKTEGVMQKENRPLTYDERKAAEAAFRGAPFDPQLSESARKVYLGISSAIANRRNEAFQEFDQSQPAIMAKRASTELQTRPRAKSTFW